MKKNLSVSDAELEVLKELWQESALTARQLTERLQQRTSWSEPTIKTLLLRLLQKNAVSRSAQDKVFVYSAVVSRDEYRYAAGRNLLDRLFNGVAGELLTCLVRNEAMSKSDIEELKKLLDDAAGK